MIKNALRALMLAAVVSSSTAAAGPEAHAQDLKAGEYAAKAKAVVCPACASEIEKVLKEFPGIEAASVSAEDGAVAFRVKEGVQVNLDELQAALKASSDRMAMGADYRLAGINEAGPERPTEELAALERVEARFVCMMNNRFFGSDQIPVEVGGRVYYGCCEGCKKALGGDPALRSAVDPVSGRPVDKATAVIGARPDGSVLYFESEETMRSYRGDGRKK